MKNFDDDIEELSDRYNKRLAIVVIVWCLITVPLMFLFTEKNLIICWIVLTIVGIRLSPWISGKIWKD